MSSYYVYVYIDPRNFEEFYFGKGKGQRKDEHLNDAADSETTRRIAAIRKAGQKPIVRVVATGLSEHDALLVEKTLLWKLGRHLTNVASGHYAKNFRPHDTLHLELPRFDYQRGIYYYNVGESTHRDWDDYRRYGFISAGQGRRWRDAMLRFRPGDVVAAYFKGRGFVGLGRITETAKRVQEVLVGGKPLLSLQLRCRRMGDNADSPEKSEYVALVRWEATVTRNNAKWKRNANLYTTTHIRASLDRQIETIDYLAREFNLDIRELAR